MEKISIRKRFTFEAAHHLTDYDGPCQNVHGHSYILEVEVSRFEINKSSGYMVMDFSELSHVVNKYIISVLDHQDLNEVLFFLSRTTAELIIDWIKCTLIQHLPKEITLESLTLYETEKCCVIWRRV